MTDEQQSAEKVRCHFCGRKLARAGLDGLCPGCRMFLTAQRKRQSDGTVGEETPQ